MTEPLQLRFSWGITVTLQVDDGQPRIGIRHEDDDIELSTRLEPDATALIAGFLTGAMLNRPDYKLVGLPEPTKRWEGFFTWWSVEGGRRRNGEAYAVSAVGDDGSPMVWAQTSGEPSKEIKGPPAEMRRAAAAILAACDESERLAAEQREAAGDVRAERTADAADRGSQ